MSILRFTTRTFRIGDPHDFCGRVGMIKRRFGGEFAGVLVQGNDLYFVVVLLDKGAESQSEPLVWPHRPVHAEYCPWRLVSEEVMFCQIFQVLRKDFSHL